MKREHKKLIRAKQEAVIIRKPAVRRIRLQEEEELGYCRERQGGGGEAATYAFAVFGGTSLTARRLLGRLPAWGWGFLALAVAVSYSLVYVSVHFPSDVLSGAIIGLSVGWLVVSIGFRFFEVEAFDERPTLQDDGDHSG